MNVIYLTMSHLTDMDTHGIYIDLMRKFRDEGHDVYIVASRVRFCKNGLGRFNTAEEICQTLY